MTTSVFPSLPGRAWPISRTAMWSTRLQIALSGKLITQADWVYPLYVWKVDHNVLRQGTVNGTAYTELQTLFNFYEAVGGSFQSFLFTDSDDNSVTDQAVGLGTGSQTVFPLLRTFGGFVERIQAPNVVTNVKLNGTIQSGGTYTITNWGTTNTNGPGCLIFNTPPAAAVVVAITYTYYFPCRFMADQAPFENPYSGRWAVKSLQFQSIRI